VIGRGASLHPNFAGNGITLANSVTDASDYTIPVHGERRGLHHVAIEVRQDLIADNKGQRAWGRLLVRFLPHAYQELVAVEALRLA
jgi:predicted N-formylglutamate amidohydrolase